MSDEIEQAALEKMEDFFTARLPIYEGHMLHEVQGCKEGYAELARLLPAGINTLLDLGCGTGLELDEIFARFPALRVTGIDVTPAMLELLREKHPDKNLALLQGDYRYCDFGVEKYDAAVSFQTMHHFTAAEKLPLYQKIRAALAPGGCYIEGDYMAETPQQEKEMLADAGRLLAAVGADAAALYHIDIPLAPEKQMALLRQAGFADVQLVWRQGWTAIIVAR